MGEKIMGTPIAFTEIISVEYNAFDGIGGGSKETIAPAMTHESVSTQTVVVRAVPRALPKVPRWVVNRPGSLYSTTIVAS
jgi:hypothetical protein